MRMQTRLAESGIIFCQTEARTASARSGSPVAFISTSIGDGGAIAPGPALTIKDLGAGVAFPVTNYSAGTGTITISGTYSAADLGGAPTTIQAQVSLTAGGPPVPGCSACAWTNLSGGVVAGGAWSGQVTNIPAGGPLFVSVRAANGQAYATMPSYMKVGLVFDWQGEGQLGAMASGESGTANSYFVGLWGLNQFANGLLQGPAGRRQLPSGADDYAGGRSVRRRRGRRSRSQRA